MFDEARYLDALTRSSLIVFLERAFGIACPGNTLVPGKYLEAIAWQLERCIRGEVKRLIIALPPRHLKSIFVSVILPAFLLGLDPTTRIICVSYADELAKKHARDCLRLMNSAFYRRLFPATRISPKKRSETEFETTRGGFRLATSIGGTLTGRGGQIIIVDDPMKANEASSKAERHKTNDFFDNTIRSRLDDPNEGIIIVVTQRTHVNDLVGHVTENEEWEELCLPLIAEEEMLVPLDEFRAWRRKKGSILHRKRYSRETVRKLRKTVPEAIFEAQHQQKPLPPGGNMIRRKWFPNYRGDPKPHSFRHIGLSVDVALSTGASADYSVILVFGMLPDGRFCVIDMVRGRWQITDLKRAIQDTFNKWCARNLVIEACPISLGLIQELRPFQQKLGLFTLNPRLDKEARVAAASFTLVKKQFALPRKAPWLKEFQDEVFAFPNGVHDDIVDALTQYVFFVGDYAAQRLYLK